MGLTVGGDLPGLERLFVPSGRLSEYCIRAPDPSSGGFLLSRYHSCWVSSNRSRGLMVHQALVKVS